MNALSRVATAAAIAAIGLAATGPATAATAAIATRAAAAAAVANFPTAGLFGLEPAPGANGRPRAYFMLTVAPGRSARETMLISNGGPTTEKLKIGVSNGITAANSGAAYGGVPLRCVGSGCWVSGLPDTVVLTPHEQLAVTFLVTVPAGTPSDQYLAGITAEPVTQPKSAALKPGPHAGAQVHIVNTVTVGVAVTVGALSDLRGKMAVTGVTASYIQALIRLGIAVRNTGQRFTRARGELGCELGSASRMYPVYMDTVIPGGTAVLTVNGIGMHVGKWRCSVDLKESPAGTATWTGEVTVPSVGPVATKRIATNDYVAPASTGVPAWAIGLFVMAGLILISLWAVLLRRGRGRDRA